jgi:putative holliday junction resolvase
MPDEELPLQDLTSSPQHAGSETPPKQDLPFPETGRLLGIDYGTVRIGVSVCDPLRILVSPLEIRQVSGREADGRYFKELAKREQASGFVVGLPIHCDGGESDKSREARAFAVWLQEAASLPVRLFDERFTTSAAQQRMGPGKGKKKGSRVRQIDAIAALVLLESFLEAARYRGEMPGYPPSAEAKGGEGLE